MQIYLNKSFITNRRQSKCLIYHRVELLADFNFVHPVAQDRELLSGGNCIKIGLPGKLILSKRKSLREVRFSWKQSPRIDFPGRLILYNWSLATPATLRKHLLVRVKALSSSPPALAYSYSNLWIVNLWGTFTIQISEIMKMTAHYVHGWVDFHLVIPPLSPATKPIHWIQSYSHSHNQN